jgi:hypothetical protein
MGEGERVRMFVSNVGTVFVVEAGRSQPAFLHRRVICRLRSVSFAARRLPHRGRLGRAKKMARAAFIARLVGTVTSANIAERK